MGSVDIFSQGPAVVISLISHLYFFGESEHLEGFDVVDAVGVLCLNILGQK